MFSFVSRTERAELLLLFKKKYSYGIVTKLILIL